MRFLLVFAAILAMTGGAQAALITYDLTFFADPDGQGTVEWGTGQVSYDPEVKQDIGFNQEGEICINSADPLCQYLATWTPVNISCNLIFAGCGGPAHIFLEGSFITCARAPMRSCKTNGICAIGWRWESLWTRLRGLDNSCGHPQSLGSQPNLAPGKMLGAWEQ